MIIRKLFTYLIISCCISSCKNYQINQYTDFSNEPLRIINPIYKYKNDVAFQIYNSDFDIILVESTKYLLIEQYNKEYSQWEQLPYQPCECGTPCPPPSAKKLMKGEKLSINWDRKIIKCILDRNNKLPISEKTYQQKGIYRITFLYHPIIDNKKTANRKLVYEFRLI